MSAGWFALLGFLAGAAVTAFAGLKAFQLAARYQRTGHAELPAKAPESSLKAAIPVNPEVSAQRRIIAEIVEQGAQDILAHAKEANIPMTLDEARAQAERMLRGESPLGGVN